MIPSGPAALSEGRRFICALISSLVGILFSSGSGMRESEGCGWLRAWCTRSASASFQGDSGCPRRSCPRWYLCWCQLSMPIFGSLSISPSFHSLLSRDVLVRI